MELRAHTSGRQRGGGKESNISTHTVLLFKSRVIEPKTLYTILFFCAVNALLASTVIIVFNSNRAAKAQRLLNFDVDDYEETSNDIKLVLTFAVCQDYSKSKRHRPAKRILFVFECFQKSVEYLF